MSDQSRPNEGGPGPNPGEDAAATPPIPPQYPGAPVPPQAPAAAPQHPYAPQGAPVPGQGQNAQQAFAGAVATAREKVPAPLAAKDPWIAALITSGFALAGALAASILITLLGLFGGRLFLGDRGGSEFFELLAPHWFAVIAQLLGAGFGGSLGASTSVAGAASFSVSALFIPVLVPIAALVSLRLFARRAVPRTDLTAGLRLVVAAAAGAAFALVAVILQLVAPLSIALPGAPGSFTTRAISFWSIIAGIALVGAAAFFVLSPVRTARSRARTALVQALEHIGGLGALIALALIAVVAFDANGAGEIIGLVLLAPVLLPFLAADGGAIASLATVGASVTGGATNELIGDFSGLGDLAEDLPSVWMFSDVFPVWIRIVLPLVAVLALAIVSVRWRLRTGVARDGASWALLPVAYAVVGVLVTLAGRVSVSASVSTSGDLSALLEGGLGGTARVAFGPAVWTFLLFAVIGAVVEVLARFVVPAFVAAVPGGVVRTIAVGATVGSAAAAQSAAAATAPASSASPAVGASYAPADPNAAAAAPAPGTPYAPADPNAPAAPHAPTEPSAPPAPYAPVAPNAAAPHGPADHDAPTTPPAAAPEPEGIPARPADPSAPGAQGLEDPAALPAGHEVPPVPAEPALLAAHGSPAAPPAPAQPYATAPVDPVVAMLSDGARERTPVSRKAKIGWLIGGSAVVVLVAALVVGVFIKNHLAATTYSAQARAEEYLSAVVDGDAGRALELWAPNVTSAERVLLASEIYAAADDRPTAYEITDVDEYDGVVDVAAQLTVDSKNYDVLMRLQKHGTQAVLFDDWRIEEGPGQTLVVGDVSQVTRVNGVEVDLSGFADAEGATALPVLPGTYTFEAPTSDDRPFTYGDDIAVTVLPNAGGSEGDDALTFVPTWTDDAQQQAIAVVQERIDLCMTSDKFQPSDCSVVLGWREPSYAVTGIKRSWTQEPELTFVDDEDGAYVLVDGGRMHIDYQQRWDEDDDWEDDDTEVSAPFNYGTVVPVSVGDDGEVSVDLSEF
ncbi:MAG: hypothetical protein ACTH34_06760 [Microbacterium gubbeenense]|uniref:hypothetical protein n=1 Tax=Microbacterium gubbeenense TaxID=159896 RepID=UPI0004288204|nr:hypothetical protein [Microbacterium gubbeenense]